MKHYNLEIFETEDGDYAICQRMDHEDSYVYFSKDQIASIIESLQGFKTDLLNRKLGIGA